ncbi:MAG: FmdB family zinc ribbon protein [Armatimonadota bacterium]
MPLFDYRCLDCSRKFSLLKGVIADDQADVCPACGGTNIKKMISRFARLRSEDDLINDLADPSKFGDPDDPGQLHQWMKQIGKEMGDDLGDDFDEAIEEAAQSESQAALTDD